MGKWLDKSFAFYNAYHMNPINQLIHIFCVWPILWTALIMLAYTNSIFSDYPTLSSISPLLPDLKLNWNLFMVIIYTTYYALVEQPGIAGIIASGLVGTGYYFSEILIVENPEIWKLALGVHIFCWVAQFYGHGAHEGRAPALFDNLFQALMMAPLFVLMEVLFKFGYKKTFQDRVAILAKKNIESFSKPKDN